jgi:hypothetical protein
MTLDGADRHHKLVGNRLVGAAGCQQPQHFLLPLGQRLAAGREAVDQGRWYPNGTTIPEDCSAATASESVTLTTAPA